ncbi:MAG: transglutaminase-like domain-containing protein [Planctomycetota bacterium]
MHRRKPVAAWIRVLTLWTACGLAWTPSARADPQSEPAPLQEAWYVVLLGDQRAGYVHRREARAGDQIVTWTTLRVRVGRGDAEIEIASDTSFVETAAGEPVRAESSLGLGGRGGEPIVTVLDFQGQTVRVTTRQGRRVEETERPAPEVAWLPPAAGTRHVEAELQRGAEEIRVTTIDPALGLEPFTTTMRIRDREPVEVFGRTVEAWVWDATASNLPGIRMREYVGDAGEALKSTISLLPGMEMTILAADRALALSKLDPPEIMAATLIEPDPGGVAINNPRTLSVGVYDIELPAGAALPITGAQSVRTIEDAALPEGRRRWRVTVQRAPPPTRRAVKPKPADPDTPLAAHTEPSGILDFRHEAVAELARLFEKNHRDVSQMTQAGLAEALRRFVFEVIDHKDLSVGFATASETAATQRGDCTEHAVLLAALLRTYDVPSRGVSGLVYVDQFLGRRGVFGYHMWTQAWLDPDGSEGPAPPRWVDLDAALDPERSFDATHLALAVDDLNAATPLNQLVELTPVMGRLELRVLRAEP